MRISLLSRLFVHGWQLLALLSFLVNCAGTIETSQVAQTTNVGHRQQTQRTRRILGHTHHLHHWRHSLHHSWQHHQRNEASNHIRNNCHYEFISSRVSERGNYAANDNILLKLALLASAPPAGCCLSISRAISMCDRQRLPT